MASNDLICAREKVFWHLRHRSRSRAQRRFPIRDRAWLAVAVAELEAAGLPYEILSGRRHPGIRWWVAGLSRTMFVPGTPSYWRSAL
jgi:hypothetical protein